MAEPNMTSIGKGSKASTSLVWKSSMKVGRGDRAITFARITPVIGNTEGKRGDKMES